MDIQRREFIILGTAAALTAALYPFVGNQTASPPGSVIRVAFIKLPPNFNRRIFYSPQAFEKKIAVSLDYLAGREKLIEIETEGHVIQNHPIDNTISLVVSRFSGTLSLVDWGTQQEIAHFRYPENQHAYGHGAFSEDGTKLFVSSTVGGIPNKGGAIYCFDVPSLKLTDIIKMPFGPPHEIINIGNNEYIFGTDGENNGGAFTIFNSNTKKFNYFPVSLGSSSQDKVLIHMHKYGDYIIANYQIKVVSSGDILREGGLVSFNLKSRTIESLIPIGSFGVASEMLSLEVDPLTSYFWYSVPRQNFVVVWDMKLQKLVKIIETKGMVSPVSFLPKIEAVLVGTNKEFMIFDSHTLQRKESFESNLGLQKYSKLYCTHTKVT